MKNCTARGFDRIKPEYLKSRPTIVVRTLAKFFTRKAFGSVEKKAVIEALDSRNVLVQYIRMLHELYDSITTSISPFYKEVVINDKGVILQGYVISPKYFGAALENFMRHFERVAFGIDVDGHRLHLRFAYDIVLTIPNIEQAERILDELLTGRMKTLMARTKA
ncbi:unnamed protein product [Haemonchus placei]|uniref:Reverse transcriptase domain-containing protein n=1 Tax=Haemonchus placei TaxID=6290 RepID=A0A0N4VSV8_HAEPC|nr:unnamed protein product [Haemonchus placei]